MIKYNLKILLGIRNRLFLIFFISLFLNACSPEQDIKNNKDKSDEVSELQKQKIPDVVLEDLNDASSYDMARFQFQGKLKGRDRYEIWSMKIDGSDLRLVINADELYSNGFGDISQFKSRSPNNRYIVLVQRPSEGMNARVLYDLKTRKRTVIISKGAVKPSIQWTQDSKFVMFYSWSYEDSESYLYQYDVIDNKLSKGPEIHSYEYYLTNNDTKFVAITKQGFVVYDWFGKKNKEVILAEKINTVAHSVSRENDILVYQVDKGIEPSSLIVNINNPKKILYKIKNWSRNLLLSNFGKYLYYVTGEGVYRVNIIDKTESKIIDRPIYFKALAFFNLYNDKER